MRYKALDDTIQKEFTKFKYSTESDIRVVFFYLGTEGMSGFTTHLFFFFFLWIGFWLSRKHPIPRVGKGVLGFGIKCAPSREGVSALDHQATPAASPLTSYRPGSGQVTDTFFYMGTEGMSGFTTHLLPLKKWPGDWHFLFYVGTEGMSSFHNHWGPGVNRAYHRRYRFWV